MALQIKIQDGTPKTGKGLCHTCKGAAIVKGQNGEERIVCQMGLFSSQNVYAGRVTFRVSECRQYHPSNMPWLKEMEEMAWIIEARRRGPKGFEQPEDGEMELVITKPQKKENGDSGSAPPQVGNG